MEIVTWNINGLRAALNKGVAVWWNERDPDVLCLQEIKAMPAQLTVEQHAKLKDFYENLLRLCDQLHASGDQIIITGNFNTAHEPIDLKNPKQNGKTSGFLPVERAWIDRYLAHGFVDVYRNLHPNLEEYTW